MIYIKVNDTLYTASIGGKMSDKEWDGRESKAITMTGSYAAVSALFSDGMAWSIVDEHEEQVYDENGEPVLNESGEPTYETKQTEFDNSAYNILGDITVHTDGTCTVKMGKETDEETLLTLLYGGEV